jgi:signal transduction histidine kinase
MMPGAKGSAPAAPRPWPPDAPPRSRRAAHALVGAVVGAAVLIGVYNRDTLGAPGAFGALLPWLIATVLAELLWLPTVTGRATSSMASTANYAAIFILGPERALWVVAIAAGLATLLIQRRSPLRALFNLSQMMITVAAAGWFEVAAGGGAARLADFRDPAALVPFLNAGLVYFVVNTGLVSAVVALWEGESVVKVWRENYGYADDLLTSAALFLLSPLMVLSYLAVGPWGLVFLLVPMLLVRNAARRYIELKAAQEQLVWNERMAAMGEMAAEIGHELANALQVINARAQMLLTESEGVRGEKAARAARIIFERAADMRRLTKGLMDFSHRTVERRRQRVNEIVRDAIDFVSPQNRYDNVQWRVDLDPSEPEADLDGGQFRQVLLNLFQNAVEAMAGAGVAARWIAVATRARAGTVEIRVRDAGQGIPAPIRERIFEPWFTTKCGGHGFGLAVCYRIVQNHGGTIVAQNGPEGGAEVVIALPARNAAATGSLRAAA